MVRKPEPQSGSSTNESIEALCPKGFFMFWGPVLASNLDPAMRTTAIAVYVTMGTFGTYDADTNTYKSCRPSRRRMSILLGCSASKIDRALAELVKSGMVTRTRRYNEDRSPLPSEYTVILPKPLFTPIVTGDETPIVTGDETLSSPVTNNQEVLNPKSVNQEKPSSSYSSVTSPTEEPQQTKEEEGDSPKKTEAKPSKEALDLIAALPAINGSRLSTKFAPRINDLLSNGWTPEAIFGNLTTGTNGANGAGIYASKLKDLPLSPPARVQPAPVAPATTARRPRTPYAPLKSHEELGVTRCEHDRVKAICPQCRGTATKTPPATRQSRNAAKTTPPATHTAQEALADVDAKVERCRLHDHSDALHCPSCWGVVKAGSDPYEGCEDQRPKGWHMVYAWSPSVKTVTIDETEVEPLNLPAAFTAMLA